jgi:hypothetical protein
MIIIQIQHLSKQCTVAMSLHYNAYKFLHFYNFVRHVSVPDDDPVWSKYVGRICKNVKLL